jgi:pyrroloquinoline quinone biosynthesis protein B
VKVRILGTAAGGGLPQWNCGCPGCQTARAGGGGRTQDCLAVSGDGSAWYLVNASADLQRQLAAAPELAPAPFTRDSPVRGVLLTSAELDHTIGLLSMREAKSVRVFATASVQSTLPFTAALSAYTHIDWCAVTPGQPIGLDGGLTVHAFAAGTKRPRYAHDARGTDWTVAYRFTDERTGSALVYAPSLAHWSRAFSTGIAGAKVVILDGTFARVGELGNTQAMGHLSIEESLPQLRAHAGPMYVYTHLNNTNPLAFAEPVTTARLAAAGARVATDGESLEL